jgi:hypothetical protein
VVNNLTMRAWALVSIFFAVVLAHPYSRVFAISTSSSSLEKSISVSASVPLFLAPSYPFITVPPSSNEGVQLDTEAGTDTILLKGFAYPGSIVTVLRNGISLAVAPANIDGSFEIGVRNLNPGTYNLSVTSKDSFGLSSSLEAFSVFVAKGITTLISDIILSPTATASYSTVRFGNSIPLSGSAMPGANILVYTDDGVVIPSKTTGDGVWSLSLDSRMFSMGQHTVTARQFVRDMSSSFSVSVPFIVGDKNTERSSSSPISFVLKKKCDLNNDGYVNIRDFSIISYWYNRKPFPVKVDLNNDKSLSLYDLSILAYCWTG